MFRIKSLKVFAILCAAACFHTPLLAAPIQWVATGSNNDMEDTGNWNPAQVPIAGDNAIFDSAFPGVNTNPTEQGTNFACSTFQFPTLAAPFNFTFLNHGLTFDGVGITGTNTDTTITITNNNTPYVVNNQIYFNGPTGTSGRASLILNNNSLITGSPVATFSSIIDRQIFSSNAFLMGNNGNINAQNDGTDSSTGLGGNIAAGVFQGQAIFGNTCTVGDDATIYVTNKGSTTATSQTNLIGYVLEWQFRSSSNFTAGDNLDFRIKNEGIDTSVGTGGQKSGLIASAGSNGFQMEMGGTCTVGTNVFFNVTNSGAFSGTTTIAGSSAGTVLNGQARFNGAFFAGDSLGMVFENTGNDSGQGVGANNIGIVSGTQAFFDSSLTIGKDSTFNITNIGNNSGQPNGAPNSVANVFGEQLFVDGAFQAGDSFGAYVANQGADSAQSAGSNFVGFVGRPQAKFNSSVTLGNGALFTILNTGSNFGTTTNIGNSIGVIQLGQQLDVEGPFQAGDFLSINLQNVGFDSCNGPGLYKAGHISDITTNASQALFNDNVRIGNSALITLSNSGRSSGSNTSSAKASGHLAKEQLYVSGTFEADNDLIVQVANDGFSSGVGVGFDTIGVVNNGSQVQFNQTCLVGDRARMTVSNKGEYTGNCPSGNYVGYIFNSQLVYNGAFNSGDNFNLQVKNEGIADTVGNSKNVGYNNGQLLFNQGCSLGDNATLLVSNKGTNSNATGTNNYVGYVNGSQVVVNDDFTAGANLQFTVENASSNTGNPTNSVGTVSNSQLVFNNQLNLNDKSIITAINVGTVGASQMVLQNGFNVLSGKATLRAFNGGVVGTKGIYIQGNNFGGNAGIVLENSSLYIDTTTPTFTIGGLDGDVTSTVESRPELIINTDILTNANFAGSILDFPAVTSIVTKSGLGTQTLSGTNTYTGLTKIQEGNLVLTGSVAGDVVVFSAGTLKGTGIIGGNLTNFGTVSPGLSIGTLNINGDYINNGGTYDVEVNGLGQSDLLSVLGTARLNGGTVVVSSPDGTFRFQQPYVIVTAGGGVLGTYTGATSLAFINPTLTYDLNNVYLTLASDLLRAADNCNQIGVASVLDGIINPDTDQTLFINALANLSLDDARDALEALSGYQYTHEAITEQISTQRFLRRLYDPLRALVTKCGSSCSTSCGWTGWLEAGDGFTNVKGKNAHKMRMNSFEVTGGIQKSFNYDLTIGLAGSYEYDTIKYRRANSHRDAEFAAIYGLYRPCTFYALADFTYGHASHDFNRKINFAGVDEKAHSKPTLNTFAFYGEAGFDIDGGCMLIQPFVGLEAGTTSRDRIKESHSGISNLSLKKHDWNSSTSRLGLHLSSCPEDGCFNVSLDFAWNYLLSSEKNNAKGRFRDFGDVFRICGDRLDRNSLDYALTVGSGICQNLNAYLEVSGAYSQHVHSVDILGGVKYSW